MFTRLTAFVLLATFTSIASSAEIVWDESVDRSTAKTKNSVVAWVTLDPEFVGIPIFPDPNQSAEDAAARDRLLREAFDLVLSDDRLGGRLVPQLQGLRLFGPNAILTLDQRSLRALGRLAPVQRIRVVARSLAEVGVVSD